jgi:S1-C subfamily serine protease
MRPKGSKMRSSISERFGASSDALPPAVTGRRSLLRSFTRTRTTLILCAALAGIPSSPAQTPPPDESDKVATTAAELLGAVVSIHVQSVRNARSTSGARGERHGTGVVVDRGGLILTSTPVVQEAGSIVVTTFEGRTVPAIVAAQDAALGIAVLRPAAPLGARALPLGRSTELELRTSVTVASAATSRAVVVATVVDRHDFATEREFLVEDAILTMPLAQEAAGAPLVDGAGKLVGVGALQVTEIRSTVGSSAPGNVFIPVEHFLPLLARLGRPDESRAPRRAWLALVTRESRDGLVATEVPPESPAQHAGLRVGDTIRAVGDSGVRTHAELYRSIWRAGGPGTAVRLTIQRGGTTRQVRVRAIEAQDYFVHRV